MKMGTEQPWKGVTLAMLCLHIGYAETELPAYSNTYAYGTGTGTHAHV